MKSPLSKEKSIRLPYRDEAMKVTSIVLWISLLCVSFAGTANENPYQHAVSSWRSYEDVGDWLKNNFTFDKSRQRKILKRLKSQGPSGLLIRNPEKLYNSSRGYCADAANFSIKTLNIIDPTYNARWVFIWNSKGRPHHWVAAFDYEGKLYIMDYGTGKKWKAMQGVHGPYNSLEEYRELLASLSIPGFEVGDVVFRDMPGKED